ncbi:MAG: hypothetical protein ABIJ09_11960 [Pseudomonadota bacterium]
MATAIVVGAPTPFGREVCAELSAQGVATIAVVHDDPATQASWAARIQYNRVRVDVFPANIQAAASLIARMKPTHLILTTGCTLGRATVMRALGVPASNYEEGNFKITDMYIDAIIKAQHHAHIAYLSAVGASARSSDKALTALAAAEQKLQFCTLPYTILRAPPLMEYGNSGAMLPLKLWAHMRRGLYSGLGLVGMRAFASARKPGDPRTVARALLDVALGEGVTSGVLEPHQLGL